MVWAYYNAINEHREAIRHRRWKILARLNLPKFQNLHTGNIDQVKAAYRVEIEIYDLTAEIGETKNLANEHLSRKNGFPIKLAANTRNCGTILQCGKLSPYLNFTNPLLIGFPIGLLEGDLIIFR